MFTEAHEGGGLRVLHVIPAVAPQYGGPSQAVLEMCRALIDRGVSPLIACTDADGEGRLQVPTGVVIQYQGVPSIFFPRQWSEALKYSWPLGRWLRAHVHEFDVVHIHAVFSHACLVAARSCQRAGVPYIVRPLGTLDQWSLRQKPLRKRLLWRLGVKRMLDGASAIHYTATDEQQSAEAPLGLQRGVVIPLGIDPSVLSAPAPADVFRRAYPALGEAPYVISLCRLHPKKNLQVLIGAFLDLSRDVEFRKWRLVVAGEGDTAYAASLRDLVHRQGAEARVLFTGWLSGMPKLAAMRGAALMALPSLQENFAISIIEALACGVPVLVSTHVNLAGAIQSADAGWVTSADQTSIRASLAEALRDDSERHRRGAAGRTLVAERFIWPALARELENLYRSLAKPGVREGARHATA